MTPAQTPPAITDSHCHLDFPELLSDLDGVIARASAAGVRRIVTICTRLSGLEQVRQIAETYPGVYLAAGIHPMHVADVPPVTVAQLVALADHPKCVAIGETGLDYHYTADSAAQQQDSLRVHIRAARETGLPLVIHARDADQDMARILSEEHAKGAFGAVMHCFSSSAELARVALALGFYLSMSGIVTFRSAAPLREIFAAAPRDRLLVETDAPYLAPIPHRGQRNEPAYTAHTARAAADFLGMSYDDFARQTEANFERLFPRARMSS